MWKLLVVLVLAGCGDDSSRHISDGAKGDGGLGPQVAPGIYITNATSSILAFDLNATGDVAPFRTISGSMTMLSLPIGCTVDHDGNIYAANRTGSSVTVYAPTASGNVAPIRMLTATGMMSPQGLIRGPDDDLIVSTCPGCGASAGGDVGVYHFPRGSNTSDFTLTGATTGFTVPSSPAIDIATSTLVVGNSFGGLIETFTAGQQGDAAPMRSFTPAGGGYNLQSLSLGATTIAMTSPTTGIDFFARDATGTASPLASITAASFGLSYPGGIYVDTTVTPTMIYVVDYSGNAVHVLEMAGSEPNLTINAMHTISGPTTMLSSPLDIAVVH